MAYVIPWNPTTPADTDEVSQGDDRIREIKQALDERFEPLIEGWPDADPLVLKAIGNDQIATAQLVDRSVTSIKIALNAILNEHIADNTLDGAKLLDASVSAAKLAPDAVPLGFLSETKMINFPITSQVIGHHNVHFYTGVAFEGALLGDPCVCGLPNMAAFGGGTEILQYYAFVASPGIVRVAAVNLRQETTVTPSFSMPVYITKRRDAWPE